MPKRRSYASLICEDCLGPFTRRADRLTRAADGLIRCASCSRRARSQGRTYPRLLTGHTVACDQCGAEFYRSPSRIGTGSNFCSVACKYKAQAGDPGGLLRQPIDNRGVKNGRYKDGKRVGERATRGEKAKVRAAVIARDGGDWCLLCGAPGPGLHLHRVRYGSQGGRYELSNCVQLCYVHHDLVHSNKRISQPKLLDYIASRE